MKKNIIYFWWRDTYAVENEIWRWIDAFTRRQSDINIDRVSLESLREKWGDIRHLFLSQWLFAEKRLFLITGGNEKRDKNTDFIAYFESVFEQIPDDHFLIFYRLTERGRDLIPLIKKVGETKIYDTLWDTQIWHDRHQTLSTTLIKRVIEQYRLSDSLLEEWEKSSTLWSMINGTFESLSLLSLSKSVTFEDVDACIGMMSTWRVFDLIDAIWDGNTNKSIILLHQIIYTKNAYEIISSLISLMRNTLYIKYIQALWWDPSRLKIHPFVLKKTLSSRISLEKVQKLYHRLIHTSIAYKSGKWMKDTELWIIFEIELALLSLKK